MKRNLARWGWVPLVALAIVGLDQWTKSLVEQAIPLGETYVPFPALDPWFRLVHWSNTGTAFGLLQGQGGLAALLALVVIVGVLAYSHQLPTDNWAVRLCLGLILGGALGNQIDRLQFGHVTDFLLFSLPVGDRLLHWPAFNVADSSIVVGTILLAALLLWADRDRSKARSTQPVDPAEQ